MKKYDLLMVLTEKCNLNCSHCYQTKKKDSLNFAEVDKILDNLPKNLARVSLEGGEVYCEKNLLYYTIKEFRKHFGRDFTLRIETNGVAFYENEDIILKEADTLIKLGVDNLRISLDEFHFMGGANKKKLLAISAVLKNKNHPLKVKYLSLDQAVAIGNAENLPNNKKQVRACMNRPNCTDHPYFFTDVLGNVYTCPWRMIPKIGNLKENKLIEMINNLDHIQQNILVGNIEALIHGNEELQEIKETKGECMVCKEIFKNEIL